MEETQCCKVRGWIAPAIVVLQERQVQHCHTASPHNSASLAVLVVGSVESPKFKTEDWGVGYNSCSTSIRPRVGISRIHIKSGVFVGPPVNPSSGREP